MQQADLEQQAGEDATQHQRGDQAEYHRRIAARRSPCIRTRLQHFAALRTERHAHAQLASAQAHRVADDAVEPEGCQKQSQSGEGAEQDDDELASDQRLVDALLPWSSRRRWECSSRRRALRPRDRWPRSRRGAKFAPPEKRSSSETVRWADSKSPRWCRLRANSTRAWATRPTTVNQGPLLASSKPMCWPIGILSGPILASQDVIDDGNLFGGFAVFVGEVAASQERNSQRRKIPRRNQSNTAVRAGIVGTLGTSLNVEARHAAVIAEWQAVDEGGGTHAGDGAQAVFERSQECGLLFVLVVDGLRQGEGSGGEASRAGSRFLRFRRP